MWGLWGRVCIFKAGKGEMSVAESCGDVYSDN